MASVPGLTLFKVAELIEPKFSLCRDSALRPSNHRHHLDLIGEHLNYVLAGSLARMTVSMPPQMAKSTLCSVALPLLYLYMYPDRHVIIISRSPQLARKFTTRIRNTVAANPWLGLRFRDDSKAQDVLTVDRHNGSLHAFGIGNCVVGYPSHLLIIDDPMKGIDDCTEMKLDDIWDKFTSQFLSRLDEKGSVLCIMQRWAEGDLIGRIKEADKLKGEWTHLTLPALATEHDILGRSPGEVLWPEFKSLRTIERIRDYNEGRGRGHLFQAVYQQNPVGGGVGRKWDAKYFTQGMYFDDWDQVPQGNVLKAISCDPSMGESKGSDFSAVVWGYLDVSTKTMWVDAMIDRVDNVELEKFIADLYRKFQPNALGMETNGFQKIILKNVSKRLLRGKTIPRIEPINNNRDGGKTKARILNLTGFIRFDEPKTVGRLRIKNSKGGRSLWHQLKEYGASAHDDGPDATEMLMHTFNILLNGRGTRRMTRPDPPKRVMQ